MKKKGLFIAVFIAAFQSCSENAGPELPDSGQDSLAGVSHEQLVLGEQLEDPYSLEVMTKALSSLYPTKARTDIVETDLYVRFLPKNEDDFELLHSLGVDLYDHPFDYRIVKEGDWYHDPTIPEDEITWQYAVVPPSFVFPSGVTYEVLDRCYIPENDSRTRSDDGIDWNAVEREAFRLSGNGSMLSSPGPLTKGSESLCPEGRVTIVDYDAGGVEKPVTGVRVNANVFVKFASAYTDDEGNYCFKTSFSSSPRYRLVFKNKKGFGIGLNLILVQGSISTLGKHPSSGVDVKVDSLSGWKMYARCAVNNAAYTYFNECGPMSIKTPPSDLRIWIFYKLNTSSAPMLQQGALLGGDFLKKYLGEYASLIKMFLPDVTIGLKGASGYSDIYAQTVHELAHASHFMQCGTSYWNSYIFYVIKSFITSGFRTYGAGTEDDHGYCEVGEMWAYFLEASLMREKYGREDYLSGTEFWFSPQIFLYLEERGLGRGKIFKALSSDVTDVTLLKNKLTSLYPEYKTTINQAYERYGK